MGEKTTKFDSREVDFMEWKGEVVRSRQNRTVVELCKLTARKEREATKKFRFDGIKLLIEALRNHLEIELIALRESSRLDVEQAVKNTLGEVSFGENGRVVILEDGLFDKISEEKSPEGVICVAKYIDKFQKIVTIYNSADFLTMENEQIILLESVRDPSNIGAVIRSAAAIGVDRLILSRDCADVYHPKAVRASMGTLFNQKIDFVASLPETVAALQRSGRAVYAAALREDAIPLGKRDFSASDCVVIGNEGHGLTEETVNACDGCVIIPMSGRAESFNAAVAASILMWEFSKKR